jgi:single-stranded DNA-binding protein
VIKRYGVLATDPELYYSTKGTPVCRMTIRGETGKWVRLVAFGETAESIAKDASKGDDVSVTGYFKERTWVTLDGEPRSEDEFVVKNWEHRK